MVIRWLTLIALVLQVGCTPSWERVPSPDVKGAAGLASISNFVAVHGWTMYTNEGGIWWEELDTNITIGGLPWVELATNRYQALTREGILFILLDSTGHHDYSGVAYNPHTNYFPESIRGFKPIGDHWYVWGQPEFQSMTLMRKYE